MENQFICDPCSVFYMTFTGGQVLASPQANYSNLLPLQCDISNYSFFRCRIQFKGDLVISSPDVSLVELGPDAEFVLLATDGLWDYMKRSFQASFI